MNKLIIIITIITMLILSGCGGKDEEPVCSNYQPFIDQNTNLMNQNTQCQTDKNKCNLDLIEQKNTNNQLKLQLLNNNTKECTPTSCNTVVRLLTEKERQLEDCWMNANATTYVTNHTEFNETLYNLYINCSTKLQEINNSLN